MKFSAYREVLAIPEVRATVLVGVLVRVPQFAMGILLTLYLVAELGRSYSSAGLVTAVLTIFMAISAPWRGHLLDRRGLRATMIPSLVVLPPVYALIPFTRDYTLLLVLAALAGLMNMPSFSVIRQAVIAATPPELRRTAISLDSTLVELCFMTGPAIGVAVAATWSTRWTLLVTMGLVLLGAAILTVANPSTTDRWVVDTVESPTDTRVGRFEWVSAATLGVLAAVSVTGFILAATDLGVVAALRAHGREGLIGLTLTAWGLGSAVAGLTYGALHRAIPVTWLTLGLGVTTALVALSTNLWSLNLWLLLAGVFCAPTLVAALDQLQALVRPEHRGQVLGWQGSMMTAGNTLAPPLVGWVIDHHGWHTGFVVAGGLGVVASVVLLGTQAGRRRRHAKVADATV